MINLQDENIIKILGIEALPNERKIVLVEKISALVQKRLLLRLMEALPQDKQDELTALFEKEDQNSANEFIAANAPDFAGWVEQEVLKVKQELADMVKTI